MYEALPKGERATLHAAFASWLERVTGDRIGEYVEVVAHHLERAYHYRVELGEVGIEELGQRAASQLNFAARRAQMRGDLPAAMALRRQALHLPMAPAEHVDVMVQQARGHIDNGEVDLAGALLDEADALAAGVDDPALRMRILVGRGFLTMSAGGHPPYRMILEDARRAAATLEAAADHVGVARAMELVAHGCFFTADFAAAREAWMLAADWAVKSGDRGEAARILPALPATATYGWSTSADAIAYCRHLEVDYPEPPMLRARILAVMAQQHAWRGEIDEALEVRERSRAVLDDLGLPWLMGEIHLDYADIDIARGDYAAAEDEALLAYELTNQARWPNAWVTVLTIMETLRLQDRLAEVRQWLARFAETTGADVVGAQPHLEAWSALLEAWEGDAVAARTRLDRTSLPAFDPADDASILELRAEALALIGDWGPAIEALRTVAATYERKEYFQRLASVVERIATLENSAG